MVPYPANCLILISFITLYPFTKYDISFLRILFEVLIYLKKSEIIPFCFKNPNNPVHVILGIFLVCKSVNITITVNVVIIIKTFSDVQLEKSKYCT